MKPFLTQQALFRATENTYIQSNHKHLPTLHWKYLKKFQVKRNCILASKKKIMLQLLEKRNIWVRQYFLNSPPLRFEELFCLVFYPLYIKYGKSIRGEGGLVLRILPPPMYGQFYNNFRTLWMTIGLEGKGGKYIKDVWTTTTTPPLYSSENYCKCFSSVWSQPYLCPKNLITPP